MIPLVHSETINKQNSVGFWELPTTRMEVCGIFFSAILKMRLNMQNTSQMWETLPLALNFTLLYLQLKASDDHWIGD
jgi:hypothetical protein